MERRPWPFLLEGSCRINLPLIFAGGSRKVRLSPYLIPYKQLNTPSIFRPKRPGNAGRGA